jgi:hypothetical protein
MMHGLPKFLYDKGMFHLEVTGPGKVTGTLILPSEDKTYLVHCDIAQHMEKGMKGQLIVGNGSGTFPSIPGITDPAIPDNYGPSAAEPVKTAASAAVVSNPPTPAPASSSVPSEEASFFSGPLIIGLLIGFIGAPYLFRQIAEHCKGKSGKSAADIASCAWRIAMDLFEALAKLAVWLYQRIAGGKLLPKK